MKSFDEVRWGIIGVGDVTEKKSGPAFYKIPHSHLVAVMRRNGEKAADYARRHQVSRWYTNGSDLINDPEVDAVYVASPPDSHAQYAIEAMKAGKPVYVEKPMAKNYMECLQMIKTSDETGMPLWVAYYRRSLPAFLKVKQLIEENAIGKPLLVNIRLHKPAAERGQSKEEMHWHVDPEIAGAGHFFDLASHQFDYLDFLFGEITFAQGRAANLAGLYPAEDTVTGTWEHLSGVIGSGSWCFAVDDTAETDVIEITGDKGYIMLSCFNHGPVIIENHKGKKELTFENPEHISQFLVEQVVDELRGIGKCISTGISAARTSKILDIMVSNYYPEKNETLSAGQKH